MDLRVLKEKDNLSDDEKICWRYTQFLVNRLSTGDRVVCQFGQPFREFWIGEVKEPGYQFDPAERKDFNHILHIEPMTDLPIPSTAAYVPSSLKHDLTKRGHYYEIYSEDSIRVLTDIVKKKPWQTLDRANHRTEEHELDEAYFDIHRQIIELIRRRWRAKEFEIFCTTLCEAIPYVQVRRRQDNHQGWDLLIRIINPVTGDILLDDVPVQCKNFEGDVTDYGPIDDLKRCINNSTSDLAYLFILGNLSNDFLCEVDRAAERLSTKRERKTSLVVVDENRIANLYLRYVLGAHEQAETDV